ncbi:uncharacterized protein LOC134185930 isoform X2 [Corticium candelabrum]|uniref:uncharacterized protein LOC134185930 isoform X2 n=1 Tax=Corticium candelabrum TaxID=121492 RepID=UPI002E26E73D|nr:uncharacterized protein LOC134185930 isoform X2 [Corticium candelabrum]
MLARKAGVCTSVTTAADGADSGTCDKDGLCDDSRQLPSITVIVPTCYMRHKFHPNLIKMFQHQTYSGHLELHLHDGACGKSDSSKSAKSNEVTKAAKNDPRIKYHFDSTTSSTPGENGVLSLGAKRNWLLERVETELVAHFDDDDYYAPNYLQEMVTKLIDNNADFVKLDGWFMYGEDYSEGQRRDAFVYYDFSKGNYLGWGWTLLYKRSLWGEFKYDDKMFMEEDRFVSQIERRGYKIHHFGDHDYLALKIVTRSVVRATGMPLCVSQRTGDRSCVRYDLPKFLLNKGFGERVQSWLKMWDV